MQENNANLTKNQAQSTHKSSTILFIVSIKLGTKKRSVYYFSFMKLIVSTFLVYKVKKCLLKSGKVNPLVSGACPIRWGSLPPWTGVRTLAQGYR